MANDWPVRIPSHIKPQIDRIAREEYRTPQDTVRMLVQRALFDRQLAERRRQHGGDAQ